MSYTPLNPSPVDVKLFEFLMSNFGRGVSNPGLIVDSYIPTSRPDVNTNVFVLVCMGNCALFDIENDTL
jgi:hypothetical protein